MHGDALHLLRVGRKREGFHPVGAPPEHLFTVSQARGAPRGGRTARAGLGHPLSPRRAPVRPPPAGRGGRARLPAPLLRLELAVLLQRDLQLLLERDDLLVQGGDCLQVLGPLQHEAVPPPAHLLQDLLHWEQRGAVRGR